MKNNTKSQKMTPLKVNSKQVNNIEDENVIESDSESIIPCSVNTQEENRINKLQRLSEKIKKSQVKVAS